MKKECWFKEIRSKNPNLKGYTLARVETYIDDNRTKITTETYWKNWYEVDGVIKHVTVEAENLTWWPKGEEKYQ